jgi:hypothetical protein
MLLYASLIVVLKETLQAKMSWISELLGFASFWIASLQKHSCIALCPNCAWHICIRVDAANKAAYELIAEPVQEPRPEEPQKDAIEHAPEDLVNLADLQGKPRSITII